ncbi:MAG: cell wall-active antibiotics response protein [Blastochloris sp.]|nr:cell wall-active antibiotics response protein [Blastochloris sp.]
MRPRATRWQCSQRAKLEATQHDGGSIAMALFTLFNDIKRTMRGPRLDQEQIATVFGDIKLDLVEAPLEPGEHHLQILTLFGDIKLRLPEDVGLAIESSVLLADIEVETVSRSDEEQPGSSWRSEGFEEAAVRVLLSVEGLFADIDIVRMPARASAQMAYLVDTGEGLVQWPSGYEGDTTRLARD